MPTNAISVDNIKFKANNVWNGLDEVRLYNGTNALYCKEGVTTGLLMRDNQIQVVAVTWNPSTPGVPTVGNIKGYIDSAGDYHYTGNGTSANATSLNSLRESVNQLSNSEQFWYNEIDYPKLYAAIRFDRVGRVCQAAMNGFKNLTIGAFTTLFTLPTSFRPTREQNFTLREPALNTVVRISIKTTGIVDAYQYIQGDTFNITGTCTWLAV